MFLFYILSLFVFILCILYFLFSNYLIFPLIFILLLGPSSEFFILDIIFFRSKISIWFYFIVLLRTFMFLFISNMFIFTLWMVVLIALLSLCLIISIFGSSQNCHLLIVFSLEDWLVFPQPPLSFFCLILRVF